MHECYFYSYPATSQDQANWKELHDIEDDGAEKATADAIACDKEARSPPLSGSTAMLGAAIAIGPLPGRTAKRRRSTPTHRIDEHEAEKTWNHDRLGVGQDA